ncbi:hypothetical protein AWV80_07605 [Cupriavidus sp. UYMU48A]|nr:hypothetical protein AWV80_07605 [Cupriavidus sp. UYMU48A]
MHDILQAKNRLGGVYTGFARNYYVDMLKAFDTAGIVLHCSSFSKTLTNAYRIGWALPGRYREPWSGSSS